MSDGSAAAYGEPPRPYAVTQPARHCRGGLLFAWVSRWQDVKHPADRAERAKANQPGNDVQPHPAFLGGRRKAAVFRIIEPIYQGVSSGQVRWGGHSLWPCHDEEMTLAAPSGSVSGPVAHPGEHLFAYPSCDA